ncbi:MAG: uroporphyrinogen-III synthase [Bacteroidales bacterium]|jgi:uroporphyrinogen-III synthase|nr:uroporphyrinogen-III synthase [Bacteroidales bacterium]MCI2121175.1 uroporphyrinogen-III synthase [Bacteroidales bacterium]MCI2145037.1 uroporphyrinogen-III synthase [Bacteroidales bacterium]
MNIKNILVAQTPPVSTSPYSDLVAKYGLNIDFKPFFKAEHIDLRDFRAQKINIPDYTAIVFTSRTAIDSFFEICKGIRYTVPETMKYFCISESIALYLQKYIVYRKRKIFFGDGTQHSILTSIGTKHKGEKFIVTYTDIVKPELNRSFNKVHIKHDNLILVRTVHVDLKAIDLSKYQMLVFYSPSDIASLIENHPDFKQGNMLFATYGPSTAKAMKVAKLKSVIEAPTPEAPSIAKALEIYLKSSE